MIPATFSSLRHNQMVIIKFHFLGSLFLHGVELSKVKVIVFLQKFLIKLFLLHFKSEVADVPLDFLHGFVFHIVICYQRIVVQLCVFLGQRRTFGVVVHVEVLDWVQHHRRPWFLQITQQGHLLIGHPILFSDRSKLWANRTIFLMPKFYFGWCRCAIFLNYDWEVHFSFLALYVGDAGPVAAEIDRASTLALRTVLEIEHGRWSRLNDLLTSWLRGFLHTDLRFWY